MNPRQSFPERAAAYAGTLSPRVHALATVTVTGGFVALAWAMDWGFWKAMAMVEFAATAALMSGLIRLADFDGFTRLVVESPRWLQPALASRPGTAAARCFDATASRAQALLQRAGVRLASFGAFAVLCIYVAMAHAAGWTVWKSLAIALLLVDGLLAMVMLRWTRLLLRESPGGYVRDAAAPRQNHPADGTP